MPQGGPKNGLLESSCAWPSTSRQLHVDVSDFTAATIVFLLLYLTGRAVQQVRGSGLFLADIFVVGPAPTWWRG